MTHDVVRPFVMTGGRTRTERRDVRVESMLVAEPGAVAPSARAALTPEQRALLDLCADPVSVAEASSSLGLVVGVTMVLASDLVDAGLIDIHQTDPVEIELDVLGRMIERVRAL